MIFSKIKVIIVSAFFAASVAAFSVPASAGHAVLVHKNGTKTEISTSGFGTVVKEYSKSGKLISQKKLSNVRGQAAHSKYVKSIRRRGDKRH